MRKISRPTRTGILVGAALIASFVALSAQVPGRSAWEGVYTADQAARGLALYGSKCASCHLETLGGGDSAPPLAGNNFMANWDKQPIGDLVDRIGNTMPGDAPGTLSRSQSTDIVAYILQVNQFPTGANELPRDAELQKSITILSSKPDVPASAATPEPIAPAPAANPDPMGKPAQ